MIPIKFTFWDTSTRTAPPFFCSGMPASSPEATWTGIHAPTIYAHLNFNIFGITWITSLPRNKFPRDYNIPTITSIVEGFGGVPSQWSSLYETGLEGFLFLVSSTNWPSSVLTVIQHELIKLQTQANESHVLLRGWGEAFNFTFCRYVRCEASKWGSKELIIFFFFFAKVRSKELKNFQHFEGYALKFEPNLDCRAENVSNL